MQGSEQQGQGMEFSINPAPENEALVPGAMFEVGGKFQFVDQPSLQILCCLYSQPSLSILLFQLEFSCLG